MKRKRQYKKKIQKRGRRISYFITIEFILKKKHKKGLGQFQKFLDIFYKTSETLLDFNGYKKYVWYINRKKSKKKNKRKYKAKQGRRFGDGVKLFYSLGKQWCNSMQ